MLDQGLHRDANPRGTALSSRERQVLEMASEGLTNLQIAQQLQVTVHAIKFHLASVYRKLHVANRTEAAVVFLQHRDEAVEPVPD